ncbi:MAG: hypothetical protein IMW85_00220 [Thermicanus sp.]|nr:hypothetical protein [Thermicanus sp.]
MKKVKVTVRCNRCGEVYTLRGRRDKNGHIHTGFRRCICDNADDFTITPDPHP